MVDPKDKRIAELEQRERVLERASSLPAQQLAEVHLRNERRLTTRIANLERQLAEAKIDSDWLIDHNAMVIYGGKILSGKARHGFWVSWPGGEYRQLGIYETAREAIDAARQEAK